VLCDCLHATGLEGFRVGLGDASLFPTLMASLQVPEELRSGLLEALVLRNFVGLRQMLEGSGLSGEATHLLLEVPQRRGGPEVLADLPAPAQDAVTGLQRVHALLAPSAAERVIFDLGLVRNIGYYTGAVFEVYDPELGSPIGGGGRYDELLSRFGRSLPAVGFALGVDRLHMALAGEERGTGALLARGAGLTTSAGSPTATTATATSARGPE
jgi:ATP phosphoribosyltransferase regulatory subunit